MLVILVFVGVVAVVLIFFVGGYNKLVAMKNTVDNSWSQIDVQLKRRHDLIPNLVETVKGFASHEKETLENVTRARTQAVSRRASRSRRRPSRACRRPSAA